MKSLAILFALALCACSTGIGRAATLAVSGVPVPVPQALDSIEAEYDLRAAYEMRDITESKPQTDQGLVAQARAQGDLQARIDDTHSLLDSLRTYVGVTKGALPTATSDAAAKARTAAIDAILARIAQAQLVKAAGANAPAVVPPVAPPVVK